MSKLERLLNLTATLLNTTIPLTADEIANKVAGYPPPGPTFRRSFERDKDDLRTLGIPVSVIEVPGSDPVVSGYRIMKEEYYLPDPGLTSDELEAINVAALKIRLQDTGTTDALWKIGASPAATNGFDGSSIAEIPSDPNLEALFGAVAQPRIVTFGYRGNPRRLEPWRLDFERGRWYVTGYDLDRDGERQFRLSRMTSAVEISDLPASHMRPPADGSPGRHAWELGEDPPQTVTLLVDPDRSAWASEVLGDQIGRTDRVDGTVFEVPVVSEAAFLNFVIGFLDHAEILSPPTVRQAFADRLEASL